jgi:hypothetical protein
MRLTVRTCAQCGKVFDPYEVDAEGRTRFCSDDCWAKWSLQKAEPEDESEDA